MSEPEDIMAPWKIMYVSLATVPIDRSSAVIEDIARVSIARNRALNVTGALICSAGAFAQILEGEADAVQSLMRTIASDPRHTDLVYLFDGPVAERRFTTWTLPLARSSHFVSRQIAEARSTISPASKARAIGHLEAFMLGMARD